MRPFPLHWLKMPMAVMMPILLRLPLVLKKSDQPVCPLCLSSSMAARTSAYSSWTNSSSSLPSPCHFVKICRASSWRSLLQSHLAKLLVFGIVKIQLHLPGALRHEPDTNDDDD
jgi:hypothetical protein